jgi:hypothetical protein
VNFGKGQKAVPGFAIFHEGGMQAGLKSDDFPFIDIPAGKFLEGSLDDQFGQDTIFHEGHATFLGIRDIDEHFFYHKLVFFWV